jgi:hypothetical protein
VFSSTYSYETSHAGAITQQAITGPASGHFSERRNSPRVPVSLEATWEGMSGNREARVTDISLHGCFLESCAQTAVGENIEFLLKTPTERWLMLRGEVAFYQPMVGFGMKFVEVSPQDEAMIEQLIEFYS